MPRGCADVRTKMSPDDAKYPPGATLRLLRDRAQKPKQRRYQTPKGPQPSRVFSKFVAVADHLGQANACLPWSMRSWGGQEGQCRWGSAGRLR